nr:hypothetical protein [Tanacetum cinerariifolium]
MAQGLIPKEKGADPLIVVLGPEHGGRTRTVRDSIERDEKRDAERDAARDAKIKVKSENVEREASNEGGLQKRRKQSSSFGDTKLPVVSKADDTITLLEQSVGSFFQWSRCRISRTLENTLTSKDKASQSKVTTLQPTLAIPIPVAEETTLLMSALQTPVLLETEQAEASSPLEDPCVKAAYLHWTTHDDDTTDHIFEVPGGMIVGHEDTFHVRVSTEDIMKL